MGLGSAMIPTAKHNLPAKLTQRACSHTGTFARCGREEYADGNCQDERGRNPETENKKEQQDCDRQTQERPPLQTLQDQESDQHSSGAHEEQMLEIQRVIELTRHLQRSQLLKKE